MESLFTEPQNGLGGRMPALRHWLTLVVAISLTVFATAVMAFSVNDEIKLGKEIVAEVEKQMPASSNEKWQADIESVGARLAAHVTRKEITYTFKIIDAKDQINAFALPGGFVYFTERMWKIMTPDERAAILAHEIVHCDKRHGVDQMLKSQQRALWMLPLIVLGGGVVAEAVMIGNMAISQRYSRKMEREADEMGIQLLHKAGLNTSGAVTSMKKLLRLRDKFNHYEVSSIFASHPDTLKRVEYLTEAAIRLGAKPESLELKAVDDPSRLGNVSRLRLDNNLVTATTRVALDHGQTVQIKKMLWDDDAQALRPITICTATVLAPGKFPILALNKNDGHSFYEIMEGDGVYPDEGSEAK